MLISGGEYGTMDSVFLLEIQFSEGKMLQLYLLLLLGFAISHLDWGIICGRLRMKLTSWLPIQHIPHRGVCCPGCFGGEGRPRVTFSIRFRGFKNP